MKGVSNWIWVVGGVVISLIFFSFFVKVVSDITLENHRQSTMESFDMLVSKVNSFCETSGIGKMSETHSFSGLTKNLYASNDGDDHTNDRGISEGNNLCINFRDDIDCRQLNCEIQLKSEVEERSLLTLVNTISGKVRFKSYRITLQKGEDGQVRMFAQFADVSEETTSTTTAISGPCPYDSTQARFHTFTGGSPDPLHQHLIVEFGREVKAVGVHNQDADLPPPPPWEDIKLEITGPDGFVKNCDVECRFTPPSPGEYNLRASSTDGGGSKCEDQARLTVLEAGETTTTTTVEPNGDVTLIDFWNHNAHFTVDQNPVPLPPPNSGHREAFAVHRPDINPSTMYMYHRCYNENDWPEICLSISNDNGNTFDKYGGDSVITNTDPIAADGTDFSVAPSVARVNGEWAMVYEEPPEGIHWATSSDGKSWSKRGALFSFDGKTRATPSVYQFDGTVYVFYAEKVSNTELSITYHTGSSMTDLHHSGNYILDNSLGSWEKGSRSMPRILESNGYYWMFYEGGTLNWNCGGPEEQNVYGWGVARSQNLRNWEKYDLNPLGQSTDEESCGPDMPQPFINTETGEVYVYHTSDDAYTVIREKLVS